MKSNTEQLDSVKNTNEELLPSDKDTRTLQNFDTWNVVQYLVLDTVMVLKNEPQNKVSIDIEATRVK